MDDHKPFYEKNGKKYISVTTAISIIRKHFLEKWRGKLGNKVCDQILESSIQRGNLFDAYAEKIGKGHGMEINFDEIKGYMKNMVMNYRDWFFENVEKVVLIKERLYSEKYLISGEPDLIAILKGRKTPDVIDIKTGKTLGRDYELQLSGYKELAKENGIPVNSRILIHVRDNKFKPVPLENANHEEDFRLFLYAKELYLGYNKKTGGKQ
jgi:CRISPR/Cas system-associated exonuclease Cas4 (RecB family)